jgi:hypothetical protein
MNSSLLHRLPISSTTKAPKVPDPASNNQSTGITPPAVQHSRLVRLPTSLNQALFPQDVALDVYNPRVPARHQSRQARVSLQYVSVTG